MNAGELRIEYRKNPIGLDKSHPRISWTIQSKERNVMQTAYRVVVRNKWDTVWDSTKIESEKSVCIPYEGKELEACTEYQVAVTIWDNKGEERFLDATFETGLLIKENWKAKWITHEFFQEEAACPVFKKKFSINKRIKSARIYGTACGVYELQLNGAKVGDAYMAPGWTSYHNRLQYQTYDVTRMLVRENELAIIVGNGWYKGYIGFTNTPNHYGEQTGALVMLRVEYEDGTVECVGTDTDWEVTTGVIRSSEIYYGEKQSLNKEKETIAKKAKIFEKADAIGKLIAQESEPVRITKRFPVKEKIITPKGELVLDFGQNMAGFVEIRLPKLVGNKLVVRHGETLDKDGNFYPDTLRAAVSIDEYEYSEKEENRVVMPHFTFHGFQYICLEGVGADVDISSFTACALHTDMQETGIFSCDNPLINQLQSNIQWSQRGNFLDIPTDCPQRDERLGWTGDAQVFCNTAAYNFNAALFYEKWMHDVAAEQTAEYGVPHVVPNILGNQAGAAAWSDCATIIPWNLYQIYGDISILETQYESMKDWVTYIRKNCGENGLWQKGHQYGDWLGLDGEKSTQIESRMGGTDKYLVANAFYAYSVKLLEKTATIIGKEEDTKEYGKLYEQVVEAIHEEYVTRTGRLVSETQTACVLLLHFDLLKAEYRERVLKTLETNLAAHKNHLTTGFTGTPYICHCLSENGKHELAEAIFLKESCPGWLYAVKKGATTIWERWDSILPNGEFDQSGMNSLNHYANGSVGDWLYRKIAGINPMEPGYKKILIQPMLMHGVTEVDASFESVYGKIKSKWTCRDYKITVDVEIPANTTATLRLPEQKDIIQVGSGSYHYEYETSTELKNTRFTMESTLGEVVAEPMAVELFNQFVPGMLETTMIQYAYGMTLAELGSMAEDAKPMYQAVIDALNK